MTLKQQYRTGTAIILFVFCCIVALIEYAYQKEQLYKMMGNKAATYLAAASSIRAYAKDVLRPRMYSIVPDDSFVLEAMSTSYISRQIMNHLSVEFPEFRYKRAALNPRNSLNLADRFEQEKILEFNAGKSEPFFSGIMRNGAKSYYYRLKPIKVETECLQCHGRPEDAPAELLKLYGDKVSFHYEVGDVVAADTIYIQMDDYYLKIKERAWIVFLVAFLTLFLLMGTFFLLFNRTVIQRLRNVIQSFSDIAGRDREDFKKDTHTHHDEIEQVEDHFNTVAEHLKTVHNRLKISEEKYRRFFESSPDAMVLCDQNASITDINMAALELFRFMDREESFGEQSFYLLFWDGQEASRIVQRVHKGDLVKDLDVSMVDRDGKRMDTLITATGILTEKEGFGGIECVIRDVTAKKRMERYLAQTEKLASIGQLAAGVAHEINNPLNVISCYARLIEKNQNINPQILEDVEVIKKHTQSCKNVVSSLLDFARVSEPVLTDVNMNACVDEILTVLGIQIQKTRISVEKAFEPDLPLVTADENMMKQVLMNLIFNAVQAMPNGGLLRIHTSVSEDKTCCVVRISDTGTGISEENLNRIFEPFFTTKKPGTGTGLGLSVSYGIIRQHGGDIKVKSFPDSGSTFFVLVPLSQMPGKRECSLE